MAICACADTWANYCAHTYIRTYVRKSVAQSAVRTREYDVCMNRGGVEGPAGTANAVPHFGMVRHRRTIFRGRARPPWTCCGAYYVRVRVRF